MNFPETFLRTENKQQYEYSSPAPINTLLNVVGGVPDFFGLDRNGCWPSRESQLPRALFSHKTFFSPCHPLNDRRRAARSLFEIGRLFSLFSCSPLARVLILLLLSMSGKVHPCHGSVFPCSVCSGNLTWRGRWV